ncbi:MAG: riboflavin synthase [Rhizomicrobium sp.]
MAKKLGIVDTSFARVDMGGIALKYLNGAGSAGDDIECVRVTVPGFKDLAVEAKRLVERDRCDVVLAMGWSGGAELDARSAQIASAGIMLAQLMTGHHILEVFIHAEEAPDDERRLRSIAESRVRGHCENALRMLRDRFSLVGRAGTGRRQGGLDAGPLPSHGR